MAYYKKNSENFEIILLRKILLTFGILIFIRMGSFFPVPGIKPIDENLLSENFISTFFRTFSIDGTVIIGLFTLNIYPYLNASIFLQLLIGIGIPKDLAELQKEGDMTSRRVIERKARLFGLFLSIFSSLIIAFFLKPGDLTLIFEISIWLSTGSMIIIWLSQLITDYGIGNGSSLFVYTNIVSNIPNFYKKIIDTNINNLNFQSILITFLLIFVLSYSFIFLQESFQKIPLLSSKELNKSTLKGLRDPKNYLPLKLNQAGVLPLISATTILVIPVYLANYLANWGLFPFKTIPNFITGVLSFIYWCFYFILIARSSVFYSTLYFKPKNISDDLQKIAVIVPGIRPGRETTFYIKQQIKRNSILSGILLGLLATLPNFFESVFNIPNLNGLSISSFLIVIGVITDVYYEVESIYFLTIYDKTYKYKKFNK